MRLSRGSGAVAWGPRFFVVAPGASSPRSRAARQVVKWDDVQPLTPEQSPDLAGRLARVGFLDDSPLVLGGERTSPGLLRHLGLPSDGGYLYCAHGSRILARPDL